MPRFWVLWSTATEWWRALNAFCMCEQRSCGRGIANEGFGCGGSSARTNKLEIQFGLLLVAGPAGRDAAKHSPPRRSQSGCGAGAGSQWVERKAAVIRKHLIFSHTTISHAYYHIPLLLPRIPIPHRPRLHKMRYFSQQCTYEYVAHPRLPFLESSDRHLQPFMGTCHHRDVA